jgi:DNA-binding transcriptional LysR family regulator
VLLGGHTGHIPVGHGDLSTTTWVVAGSLPRTSTSTPVTPAMTATTPPITDLAVELVAAGQGVAVLPEWVVRP